MSETILQFGTGNFLRAFICDFIDSLNAQGLYGGSIVVVSPTDSINVGKINAVSGRYGLILRGISGGEVFESSRTLACISRAINPYRSFPEFLGLAAAPELRFIVSNTTEAGIAFDPSCGFGDEPPASFPAKLTRFLFERYRLGGRGFVILPCELIEDNAGRLREYVKKYAALWQLGAEFEEWLDSENVFCETLVDRIVSGFSQQDSDRIFTETGERDELLTVAEPYHLWAVAGDFERELPLKRGGVNVIWDADVAAAREMKVRLLNGSHTSMVFLSMLCGVQTVAESLKDPALRAFLDGWTGRCAMPTLGDSPRCREFASAVYERFSNPFLHHRWSSISLNSVSKFTARVLPTARELYKAGAPVKIPALSLAALVTYYKENDVSDSPDAVRSVRDNGLARITADRGLWGEDVSFLLPDAGRASELLREKGAAEAIQWSLS
ncbi:MAG: tagaturonate reductase [Clostridia bacterium]|nr:tagaturonate reductase [Clostridia bacterium]